VNTRILVIILFILILLFLLIDGVNGKEEEHSQKGKEILTEEINSSLKAVEVNNRICPVSGLKIQAGKEIKYEYKGKIYNFFSTSGVEEFKKNPEKYIQILESWMKIITKEKFKTNDYSFKS